MTSNLNVKALRLVFEESNMGDVFDKSEASVYYKYAGHIKNNDYLHSPDNGM